MQSDELDLEFAEGLLEEKEEDTPKKPRSKQRAEDNRTIAGWFALVHTSERNCEVPAHDDEEGERPRNKGMVVIISDRAVCRVCFLNQKDMYG